MVRRVFEEEEERGSKGLGAEEFGAFSDTHEPARLVKGLSGQCWTGPDARGLGC